MTFAARLAAKTKLGIDLEPFRLYLRGDERHAGLMLPLFEAVERGRLAAVTSVVTLLELLVDPYRRGDDAAVMDLNVLLPAFPHLALVPLDQAIADKAAAWQARHGLGQGRCIQLATAVLAGADGFVTLDPGVRALEGEIDIILLEEYL
ncbi:MAG: PilT protein domain protein [Cyanobacteria bacterium RYN_339]|nr:PilT protein domain protein [Cyanobacteria bacterium RYN_339]